MVIQCVLRLWADHCGSGKLYGKTRRRVKKVYSQRCNAFFITNRLKIKAPAGGDRTRGTRRLLYRFLQFRVLLGKEASWRDSGNRLSSSDEVLRLKSLKSLALKFYSRDVVATSFGRGA